MAGISWKFNLNNLPFPNFKTRSDNKKVQNIILQNELLWRILRQQIELCSGRCDRVQVRFAVRSSVWLSLRTPVTSRDCFSPEPRTTAGEFAANMSSMIFPREVKLSKLDSDSPYSPFTFPVFLFYFPRLAVAAYDGKVIRSIEPILPQSAVPACPLSGHQSHDRTAIRLGSSSAL